MSHLHCFPHVSSCLSYSNDLSLATVRKSCTRCLLRSTLSAGASHSITLKKREKLRWPSSHARSLRKCVNTHADQRQRAHVGTDGPDGDDRGGQAGECARVRASGLGREALDRLKDSGRKRRDGPRKELPLSCLPSSPRRRLGDNEKDSHANQGASGQRKRACRLDIWTHGRPAWEAGTARMKASEREREREGRRRSPSSTSSTLCTLFLAHFLMSISASCPFSSSSFSSFCRK